MQKIGKRLTGLLLILMLMLSSTIGRNVVMAEDGDEDKGTALDFEVVENDSSRIKDRINTVDDSGNEEAQLKGDVRVSIVLEGRSTIEQGYSVKGNGLNAEARAYRDSLRADQDAMAQKISKEALGGEKLDVAWNLTLAANIISATVPAEKIYAIRDVIGVKDVIIENRYAPDVYSVDPDDPNMSTATEMTNAQYAWAAGYTGAGSKIAIVDTGIDTDHISFDPKAFEMAISEINNDDDPNNDVRLMNQVDVERMWMDLNASEWGNDPRKAYVNSKIPFGFNYVDGNYHITHSTDTEGEHGSHVASIAAGNKYIYAKNEDGSVSLKNALTEVHTQGNAPDAQLLVMKVFGAGGGAYDSDYFAAIEDAMVMGADAVNLSLGSSTAGFVDTYYQDIVDNIRDCDIVWANSAGNNGSWADQTKYGMLYSDGMNFATGGSPATFSSTMSVASVDNKGFTGYYMQHGDRIVFYTESSGFSNTPIHEIAGEYEYVYVDGYGTEEDFDRVADILPGKIAFCSRGSTSFYQKANAAASRGAIATVIVNNEPGTISMNLSGYEYTAPCVSITMADGLSIYFNSDITIDEEMNYATGTITVGDVIDTVVNVEDGKYEMSSFSSFGVPGDLSMKPEITTPGGNIYAVNGYHLDDNGNPSGGHDTYENMSGTSMASPQLAGLAGVMAQYVRESGLDAVAEKLGITRRVLIQSLLMSTAEPLYNANSESFYSILNQGAGLANVDAAINSNVLILMDKTEVNGEARKDISVYAKDGKVKAELGDDPDRSGKYAVEFSVTNMTKQDRYFEMDGDMFTQDIYEYDDQMLLDTWTTFIDSDITWYVDGLLFVPEEIEYDFNDDGDGVYDDKDAQAILDYVVGVRASIGDMEYADLNEDGVINTRDAYEALKLANKAELEIPAEGTVKIRAEIELSDEIDDYDVNGAYVEGYLAIGEKDTEEGEIGVVHTIPVLGYYGSWGEGSIADVGSNVEFDYELEERVPYMYVALKDDVYGKSSQGFIGKSDDLGITYYLGGNPLGAQFDNGRYYPERNAFNTNNMITGVKYSQIRNVVATQIELLDEEGNTVKENVKYGQKAAAYYLPSAGQWQNTTTSASLGYRPTSLGEDESFLLNFRGATEYHYIDGEADFSDILPSMSVAMNVDNQYPVIDAAFAKRIVTEEEVVDDESGETTMVEKNSIMVTITAHDNEYIAGLFVFDDEDNDLLVAGSRSDEKTQKTDYQDYVIMVDGENYTDHLMVEISDYALNVTTVKINLNREELDDPVEISLDRESFKSIVGVSVRLNANILPWGIDPSVTWSSADESVATVSASGEVTGVGEGTTTITATSVADPGKSATCEVSFVNSTFNSFLWDEGGNVLLANFNPKDLPNYVPVAGPYDAPMFSTARGADGQLYAATFNSSSGTSSLYAMDEETYEVSEIGGTTELFYADMADSYVYGEDILVGVYAYFIVLIDATTGDYLGAFNLRNYTGGNWLVGITHKATLDYTAFDYGYVDYYYILDENGDLYDVGLWDDFTISMPHRIGNMGYAAGIRYYQSLYFDGDNIFWSKYDSGAGRVDLIMVNDIYGDHEIFELGSFEDDVWPVGGLYSAEPAQAIEPGDGEDDMVPAADVKYETQIEPLPLETMVSKGGLNAVRNYEPLVRPERSSADYDEDDDTFVVMEITAEEAQQHNGLYTIEYDTEVLDLLKVSSPEQYHAKKTTEEGKVTFGFIDLFGVDKDAVVAKVVFVKKSTDATQIKLTTSEANEDYEAKEETFDIAANVKVSSLTVDPDELKLEVEDTYDLITEVLPETATNPTLSFMSDNEDVATVDENGKVTAVGIGKAVITVSTTDGSDLSETVNVEVLKYAESITLSRNELAMDAGKSTLLVATILPEEATYRDAYWSSSDDTVVAVYQDGRIVALKEGVAIITARTTDGTELEDSCTVTVTVKAESVSVSPSSLTLEKGKSANIKATVLPADTTNKAVTYTSSDTSVATVDKNGKVTGKKAGTVTITVKTADGSGKTATVKVTVVVKITAIKANPMNMTLEVGKTGKFAPTITPTDATTKKLTYKSSNTAVATVDAYGKITAKKAGTAKISATTTDGTNLTATCSVTVVVRATSVKLNYSSVSIVKGNTLTVKATVAPTNATNKKVTWKSSNTAVATVDANGKITAKKAGTATITCTTADGSNKSASVKVTVKNPVMATGVTLSKSSLSLKVGKTATVTATVAPASTTNKKVTWKSSNTGIATVDANGKITAKKAGTATITCTTADGSNKKATVKVTVTK